MNTLDKKPSISDFVDEAVSKVCARHDCTPEEVLGPRRFERLNTARHMAYWILRREPYCLGYETIGRAFKRQHGSIIHGCRKTNDRLEVSKEFQRLWPEFTECRVQFRKELAAWR